MGLSSFFLLLGSVKLYVSAVQGHCFMYQSKARMRHPISPS